MAWQEFPHSLDPMRTMSARPNAANGYVMALRGASRIGARMSAGVFCPCHGARDWAAEKFSIRALAHGDSIYKFR